MFIVFKLIFRNILNHKKRNILFLVVIGFLTTLIFLVLSFTDGEIHNFKNGLQALRNPVSDIVAFKKGYLDAKERKVSNEELISMTIENYFELRKELMKFDFIKKVYNKTMRVSTDIKIKNQKFKWVFVNGIEKGYDEYFMSKIEVVEGNMIKDDNGILLNVYNKNNFNAIPGDIITVSSQDLFGQAVLQDFILAGYFKPKIDNPNLSRYAYVYMNGYDIISGFYSGEALELNIDLKGGVSRDKSLMFLNEWAEKNNIEVEFYNFYEVYPDSDDIYGIVKIIILIICFFIIFIVSFGIMNIVSLNLIERRKEIGTYYCLGTEKSFLKCIYTLEIIIINLLASTFGITFGLIIRFYVNLLKISTTNPGMQLVFGGSIFNLGFSWSTIFWIISSMIIMSSFISLITLSSALKVSPSVAMRETI